MWPKQNVSMMNLFYGDPDGNRDGLPDPRFEAEHLTYIEPPYPMVFSWNEQTVKRIRVNKKCADSLHRILERIGHEITPLEREKAQLNRLGGVYNFRLMRGKNQLSTHSWGAAIDLAPALNPLGKRYDHTKGMMPVKAVKLFQEEGWIWGGLWPRPDAMHFQACII